MKLHQAVAAGTNTFTGYGSDYVAVNGERREKSSIVLPDRILDWNVAGFDALRAEDFQVFESSASTSSCSAPAGDALPASAPHRGARPRRVGVEVMDLQAACRTYNIPCRRAKVAAALLFR